MARFRMTDFSTPLGGFGWERKDDDREVARRVINLFGDRRMLWKDFSLEIEEECVSSASKVRDALGQHLDNPDISAHMQRRLQALQAMFREFMDSVPDAGRPWGPPPRRACGTDPLSEALGRLRALVGVQVGAMASDYDLEIPDQLAQIVPDQSAWFFERFE